MAVDGAIGWNEILALSTLIMAIAAVGAIYFEHRRARFIHSVDMIVKFDDYFHSPDMRQLRRAAAKALLDKTNTNPKEVWIILDFFEKVGCLTRYGVLDRRMVWHEMYHWIHRYCLSSAEYMKMVRTREKDDTLWEDLIYLHKELVEIEKKERKCPEASTQLTEDELKMFLDMELDV